MTIVLKSKDFSRKGLKGDMYRLLADSLDEIGYSKALTVLTDIATKSWKYSHEERVKRLSKILNSKNLKLSASEKQYANKMLEMCYNHVHKTSGTKRQIQNIESVLNGYANLHSQLNGTSKVIQGNFEGEYRQAAGAEVCPVYNQINPDNQVGSGPLKYNSRMPMSSSNKPEQPIPINNVDSIHDRPIDEVVKSIGEAVKKEDEKLEDVKLPEAKLKFRETSKKNLDLNREKPGYVQRNVPEKKSLWQRVKEFGKKNLFEIAATGSALICTAVAYYYVTTSYKAENKPQTKKPIAAAENIEQYKQRINRLNVEKKELTSKLAAAGEPDDKVRDGARKGMIEQSKYNEVAGKLIGVQTALEEARKSIRQLERTGIDMPKGDGDADVYEIMSMIKVPERKARVAKDGSLTEVVDIEYIARHANGAVDTMEEAREIANEIAGVYDTTKVEETAFEDFVLKKCGGDAELAEKIIKKFEGEELQPSIWDKVAQYIMVLKDGRVVYQDANKEIVVLGTKESVKEVKEGELK